MGTFDLVLLILFFGFVGAGFWFGFIHTLGAIIGVVIGAVAASHFYPSIASFFEFMMFKRGIAEVLAFVIIFLVVSRLVGWIAHMFDQGFKIVRIIPFVGSANRLAGALLGFVEATLVLGTILLVASHFDVSPEFSAAIDGSPFAGLLMTIAKVLAPFLPDGVTADRIVESI